MTHDRVQDDDAVPDGHRPKGWLANDVQELLAKVETGEIVLTDQRPMTPHRIAKLMAEVDKTKRPSTGAIGAVLKRWRQFGFAEIQETPLSFVKFTEAGLKLGYEGCKEASQRVARERAARLAETSSGG